MQYEQKIDDLKKDLGIRIDHIVKMRGENFNFLGGKLGALNPLSILDRGYSVTVKLPDGAILKNAASSLVRSPFRNSQCSYSSMVMVTRMPIR